MKASIAAARKTGRLLGLGAAGCGLAALAACGGSAAAPAGKTASAPATQKPPAKAQLKKMVVQSSDLGQGWKTSPEPPTPKNDTEDPALDKCEGIRAPGDDTINSVNSTEFAKGPVIVHSYASSVRSSKDITADFAPFTSPRASRCVTAVLRKSMPDNENVTADPTTVTAGSDGVPGVDATIDGSLITSVNGNPNTVYSDEAMIAGPLTEATVTVTSDGSPVPKSLFRSIVAAVAKRVSEG